MNEKYDPALHHRRSIRLQGYDYSISGLYFLTFCVHERECLLGEIRDDKMELNDFGKVVAESWLWLSEQYSYVELDEWVVMPNHLHGILVLEDRADTVKFEGVSEEGGSRTAPTAPTVGEKRKTLGRLIGAFKTVSIKRVNELRKMPGVILWQRNYYEHVIRSDNILPTMH